MKSQKETCPTCGSANRRVLKSPCLYENWPKDHWHVAERERILRQLAEKGAAIEAEAGCDSAKESAEPEEWMRRAVREIGECCRASQFQEDKFLQIIRKHAQKGK